VPPRPSLRQVALLLAIAVGTARAQDQWHTGQSLAGAALGGASGAIVGSVGSLVPCNDTYAGPHCVRWVAAGAALVGGVAGAVVGGLDPSALESAAVGGAIGFGIGAVLGAGLTPLIVRWAPEDALALGLIGGAVGTAPIGAAIGFGGGAILGLAVWRAVPAFGSPNAAALALGGLAAGVLTEWVVRAASAEQGNPVSFGFHVRF